MKHSILLALILPLTAVEPSVRTCRILFLEAPASAPTSLFLFDGSESREVDLPRMNFSKVYSLPAGALRLHLLSTALDDPEQLPDGAPCAKVSAGVTDFYLLLTSDPENKVAPVRMQAIHAGSDRLKRGQMLWFNLTRNTIGGTVGSERLVVQPGARTVIDPPARGNERYQVDLGFRIPDEDHLYPLCETKWMHDPRSRSVAFIIPKAGIRTPRVLVFPDFRDDEQP
ncbi:hypothetical protein [Haloferula sp. A504]|uniref:hypothetical protein n=1 Tax=Haloferula sp. A504 TaxID=3373601 RepID=UPI0031BD4A6B|nr:hypothetical protein [Verrucomicrobiaceae bacterium E54]